MRILFAEDNRDLGEWLSRALNELDIAVDWIDDGRLIETSLAARSYDALILDLGLPGIDGRTALLKLRAADQRLPVLVLVLTARDSLNERVATLHEGADDFLVKPFALSELEARLTALIRRARGSEHPRMACGPLALDTVTRQFTLAQQPLALSKREHAVLASLITRSGEPVSKQDILSRAFRDGDDVQPEIVEVIVHRLRKKLEHSGVRIQTLRGMGYALEAV